VLYWWHQQQERDMKTFKIEIELTISDEATPDFVFVAINDLLEDGESMTVARYMEVTEDNTNPAEVK
jgi:hypothetical protein